MIQAQEQERARLARELHDGVGQMLTVVKMEADWVDRHAHDPQEVASGVAALGRKLDETLGVVRSLSYQLRPAVLDDLGVACALESLVDEIANHSGISCSKQIDDVVGLSSGVATATYRIAQEALANAVRHAQARTIVVRFGAHADAVQLVVEDDGIGISAAAVETGFGSLGIAGMRERAELLGGTLHIDQRAGGGTRLLVRLPRCNGPAVSCPATLTKT